MPANYCSSYHIILEVINQPPTAVSVPCKGGEGGENANSLKGIMHKKISFTFSVNLKLSKRMLNNGI